MRKRSKAELRAIHAKKFRSADVDDRESKRLHHDLKEYEAEKILNPRSKSDIVIFIDKNGQKRWKWKNKKNAIYGKEK